MKPKIDNCINTCYTYISVIFQAVSLFKSRTVRLSPTQLLMLTFQELWHLLVTSWIIQHQEPVWYTELPISSSSSSLLLVLLSVLLLMCMDCIIFFTRDYQSVSTCYFKCNDMHLAGGEPQKIPQMCTSYSSYKKLTH